MSTVERTAFYCSKVGQEIARQALALLLVANLQKKKGLQLLVYEAIRPEGLC